MPRKHHKARKKRRRTVSRNRKAPSIISVLPPQKNDRSAGALFWLGCDTYEAVSDTKAGVVYLLVVYSDGTITCSCEDFKKHRGRLCKHGKRVLSAHNAYTDQQRDLWSIGHQIPAAAITKNHIAASRQFYQRNVIRRTPPFVRFADGRSMRAHKESMRCTWEKRSIVLLKDLLVAVESAYPEIIRPYELGPPGRSTIERVFAVLVKVMEGKSIARTIQRIDRPAYQDVLGDELGKNSVYRYYKDPLVNAALDHCLRLMALAVSPITKIINVDGSGFPTIAQSNYRNDNKGRDKIRPGTLYYKGHVASCAATNIIAAILSTFSYGKDSSDYSQFEVLLARAFEVWRGFTHVLADKAYFSDDHIKAVDDYNAMFVCPPKAGWDFANSKHPLLARRLHNFYRSDEFSLWYSWRAKIESVFATIEMLFGKELWARGPYKQLAPLTEVPLSVDTEMKAKAVLQNACQFAFLEAILEQELSFTQNRMLYPLPLDCVESGRTLLAA